MSQSKYVTWLLATRPKTLPAGMIPVLIGSALAVRDNIFDLMYFALVAICALFIQIITNFINEIYDYKKGADTKERVGPERAVASGKITSKQMTIVSAVLMIITFVIGMIIVERAGLEILWIGISSLFFAWAYTGGPYPLAYKGLGELFVLIYFGLVAVAGTYAVFAQYWTLESLIWGLIPGFISMNILGINNIRDIDTDRKVNKMTLAARIGRESAERLFVALFVTMYMIHAYLAYINEDWLLLIPSITIPITYSLCVDTLKAQGQEYNIVLAKTGKLLVIHGVITSVCIIL